MVEPLVDHASDFAVIAIALTIALAGIRLEKTKVGQRLSGAVIAILLAALLANINVLPSASPAYDFVWTYLVPLAIALFLIKADLITIVKDGGRTLIAFACGAVGAVAGTYIGLLLLPLNSHGNEYAAILSATFVGGSLNFAAVADAIDFRQPTELAAATAVDNILGILYLVLLGFAARWAAIQTWLPAVTGSAPSDIKTLRQEPKLRLGELMQALAIGAGACALGRYLSGLFGHGSFSILYITVIMLVVATAARRWVAHLGCSEVLAMMFMYLFFVMLGAGADLSALLDSAVVLFLYVGLIIATHVVFAVAGAKLLRLNYRETIVASSACIGGPPIAVAIAMLCGWRNLVAPGVVTGVFGYAVGNFIGIGVYATLQ